MRQLTLRLYIQDNRPVGESAFVLDGAEFKEVKTISIQGNLTEIPTSFVITTIDDHQYTLTEYHAIYVEISQAEKGK